MVTKAADDMEAIRAGILRIEDEKRRILNGISHEPEAVPIEVYEQQYLDINNAPDPTMAVQSGQSNFPPWGLIPPKT